MSLPIFYPYHITDVPHSEGQAGSSTADDDVIEARRQEFISSYKRHRVGGLI